MLKDITKLMAITYLITSCSGEADFSNNGRSANTNKPSQSDLNGKEPSGTDDLDQDTNQNTKQDDTTRIDGLSKTKTEIVEWKALYDASFDPSIHQGAFIVTPAEGGKRGLVISKKKYNVDNVSLSFKFQFDNSGGSGDSDGRGADGINFAITPLNEDEMNPEDAGAIGFRGIGGFSVELDTYDNGSLGDPDGNHIAIMQDVNGTQHLKFSDKQIPKLNDGSVRELTVVIEGGLISVILDGVLMIEKFQLPNYQAFEGHLAFSSATGGGWNRHMVWDIFAKVND